MGLHLPRIPRFALAPGLTGIVRGDFLFKSWAGAMGMQHDAFHQKNYAGTNGKFPNINAKEKFVPRKED